MSTPINADASRLYDARIADVSLNPIEDRFAKPFLPNRYDLTAIVQKPQVSDATVTVPIHGGEGGAESGNVTYTPGDFASMKAAALALTKSGDEKDFLEGQELMQKAYRILQAEMLEMQLQQQIFNSVIQALSRAAG